MTPDQIKAALDAGILDETQAEAMRGKLKTSATPQTENADKALIGNEDDMRFVRS
ncbi:MAG: hypothetical protein JKX72_06335, partial [Robiginitomaculum sp.]|nr:hypothetical protein [Robiginitomaculum sp.]